MIRTRQDFITIEEAMLANYAIKSSDINAIKRDIPESSAHDRTPFQRDRDRIIYSKSFMRLKGKTQVMASGHGDHYRTRLTHSHYVATIGRDISRRLALNEDLTEVIALAHDIGHTCFGHAGQDALNSIMQKYGSHFEHNEQSLWVVEKLEEGGLNLTQAVRDGLDKHRTAYDNPRSQNNLMPSLEAQVVNLSDEIAYRFHDLDDGLRENVFTYDNLSHLKICKMASKEVYRLHPECEYKLCSTRVKSRMLKLMIDDLVKNTNAKLVANNINSPEQVYNYSDQLVDFSDTMRLMVDELGKFLYKNFYRSFEVMNHNKKGVNIIKFLFETYYNKSDLMPEEFTSRLNIEEKHIVVKDYIAGMTDDYATEQYESLL